MNGVGSQLFIVRPVRLAHVQAKSNRADGNSHESAGGELKEGKYKEVNNAVRQQNDQGRCDASGGSDCGFR